MIFAKTAYPAKIQVVPKFVIRLLVMFDPALREVIEIYYEFKEPFIADHSKFESTFGNHTAPLKQAIHDTIEWFKINLNEN